MWSCAGVGGFNLVGSKRLWWNTKVCTSIFFVCGYFYVPRGLLIFTRHILRSMSICPNGNGWVSPVNLHGAQHELLTDRSCFVELVEHEGLHVTYVHCQGSRVCRPFRDHRLTIARTRYFNSNGKYNTNTTIVSTMVIYALDQTFPWVAHRDITN